MIYFLKVPFTKRYSALSAGAKWSKEHRSFLYQGDSLPIDLLPYQALPYSLESYKQSLLNKKGQKKKASVPLKDIVLRPHQSVVVQKVTQAFRIKRVGYVIGDDVGLGKTYSAWQSIGSLPGDFVLIVCPLSVIPAWRLSILNSGDFGKTIILLNYDRLSEVFFEEKKSFLVKESSGKTSKTSKTSLKSKSTRKRVTGNPLSFDFLIWDESHKLKNPTSMRSKLAMKITAKSHFTLWLSATIGQNPLELSYMSPLLAQMTCHKVSDLKEFEKWCSQMGLGVARAKFGAWEWSGSDEDIKKVHRLLFEGAIPAGIRRVPEDIQGWPKLSRSFIPVDLGESYELYDQVWSDFRKELGLSKTKKKDGRGILVAQLRLRQKISLLKVDATYNLVCDLLEKGYSVAVSVAFQETLDLLKEKLESSFGKGSVAMIHGKLSGEEKEENRLLFQKEAVRIILFTVEEGISLHQGEFGESKRSQIIHDIRWSAIQMSQIEGRTHRDGKFSHLYWMYGLDTIDSVLIDRVLLKMRRLKMMIGDDVVSLDELRSCLENPSFDFLENGSIFSDEGVL